MPFKFKYNHNFFKKIPLSLAQKMAQAMAEAHPASPATVEDRPASPTRVNFDTMVKVVLIPSIEEYKDANLADKLWATADEKETYKQGAVLEISAYAKDHNISFKAARNCLYRSPSPLADEAGDITDNESNSPSPEPCSPSANFS